MTPEERARWDVDPDQWPHTPPLHVFRELMEEDGNTWWRAGSGHGLNAYEAAVERLEELEAWKPLEDFRAGVAAAGACLVGVVAARLGDTHPVLEAMVIALGQLAETPPPPDTEKPPAH